MTSGHETDSGCRSWPSVLRGESKNTARLCDSDMNTVYLTGFCVHTDFPLRPLSEPGCRPSEGLRAWQTCWSSVMVSLLDSCLVKRTCHLLGYYICIPKKHNTIDFEFDIRQSGFWVCSSVVAKALSFQCSVWCKIFSSVRLEALRDRLWGEVQLFKVQRCSECKI